MGKTATNLSIVLGIVTVAYAGYYFYTQKIPVLSEFQVNQQTLDNMLNNTKVFITHRDTLSRVRLDYSFFEDERFLSLQNFRTPVPDQSIGRSNPFAEIPALADPE